MWQLATFAAAALLALPSRAYMSFPFNTSYYYGPDGPWQAVSLSYRYTSDGAANPVNLLPGIRQAEYAAYVPTTSSCSNSPDPACAAGGTMEGSLNYSTYYHATDTNSRWSYNFTGLERRVTLVLPSDFTHNNALAVACSGTNTVYPNGKSIAAEIGMLNLGGSGIDTDVSGSTPEALSSSNYLQSNSFALHYGAAMFDYPGSLIYGGYDPGRIIGPLVSFSAGGTGTVPLMDINIGVETGGSPFSFPNKTDLLLLTAGATESASTQAYIQPNLPYIYLPQPALDAITANLPVTFHNDLGYYLWNTDDPAYKKIITSPAYLGFTFPISDSSAANTTIKVPFALLNMTLSKVITGMDNDVPYLPFMVVDDTNLVQPGVWLGRAFLQSAFTGTNWGNNASWLAQAPGPGDNKEGLGASPQDMSATATTLNVQSGDGLFNSSWAAHLTPLPESDKAASSSGSGSNVTPTSVSSSGGLSGGAIAGIVVGVVVGLALIGGLVAFLLVRRRKQRSRAAASGPDGGAQGPFSDENTGSQGMTEYYSGQDAKVREPLMAPQYDQHQQYEMPGSGLPPAPGELPGAEQRPPQELSGGIAPQELPADNMHKP